MDSSIVDSSIANIKSIVTKFYKYSPSLKNKIQELSGKVGDEAAAWAADVIDNDYCPTHTQIEHSSMLSAALQSDLGTPFNVFFNGEKGNMPKLKINPQMSMIESQPNYADNNLVMLPDIEFDPPKYKITFTFHGFAYYDNLGKGSLDSSVIDFYPYQGTYLSKEIHGTKNDMRLTNTRMTSAVYQRVYEYNGYPELQFRFKGVHNEDTHERYVRLLDADFDNVWEPEENDFKYIYNDPDNKFINYSIKIDGKYVILPCDKVLDEHIYTLSDIEDDINVDVYADVRRTVSMKINTYGKLDVNLQLPDMHKQFVSCVHDGAISDVQFDMGVVLKIPVGNENELITIESTPSYHYYTINGIEATEDLTEYIVTDDDAELGYVPVVATNRAYIRTITLKRMNVDERTVSWDWSDRDNVDDVDIKGRIGEIPSDEDNNVKIFVDATYGRARTYNGPEDADSVLKVEYGAILRIPVRHKNDVITIRYNNGTDEVEYIANQTDADNRYYEISTQPTEVLNIHSISIKQVPYYDENLHSEYDIVTWNWKDGRLPVKIKDKADVVESNNTEGEHINLDVDATLYDDSVCIIRDPKRYYMMKCPYSNVNMFKLKIKMTENEIEKQRQKDECEYESVMCTFAYGGISLEPFELPLGAVDDVLTLDSRTSFQSETGKIVFQPNVSYSLILKLKKKMKFKDIKFIVLNSGGVSNIQVYHNYIQLSPMFNMSSNNITYSVIPTEDELKGAKPALQNMRIVLPANSALIPGRSIAWDYITIGSVPYGGYRVYFSEGDEHFTRRTDGSYVYEMPPYYKPNLAYGVTIYATFVSNKNAVLNIIRYDTNNVLDVKGRFYELEVYDSADLTEKLLSTNENDFNDDDTEDYPPYSLEAKSYNPNTIHMTIRRYQNIGQFGESEEDNLKFVYSYTLLRNGVVDESASHSGIMGNGQFIHLKFENLNGFDNNTLRICSMYYIPIKKISVSISGYLNHNVSYPIINDPDVHGGQGYGIMYIHARGEELPPMRAIPYYLPDDENPEIAYYDYDEFEMQTFMTPHFKLDFSGDTIKKYRGIHIEVKQYYSEEDSEPGITPYYEDILLNDNDTILEIDGYGISANMSRIKYEITLLKYDQYGLSIIYDRFYRLRYNRLYDDDRWQSLIEYDDLLDRTEYRELVISKNPKISIEFTPIRDRSFFRLYYHQFTVTGINPSTGLRESINLSSEMDSYRVPGSSDTRYNLNQNSTMTVIIQMENRYSSGTFNIFTKYRDVQLKVLPNNRADYRRAYVYPVLDIQRVLNEGNFVRALYPKEYKIWDKNNSDPDRNSLITLDTSTLYTYNDVEYIRYYSKTPLVLRYTGDNHNEELYVPKFEGDNLSVIDGYYTNSTYNSLNTYLALADSNTAPINTSAGLGVPDNGYWTEGVGGRVGWDSEFGKKFSTNLPQFRQGTAKADWFSTQLANTFGITRPTDLDTSTDDIRLYLYLYINTTNVDLTTFKVLKIREIEPYEVDSCTGAHIHKDIPSWVREDIENTLVYTEEAWNKDSDKAQVSLQELRRAAFEPFEIDTSVGPDFENMWVYNPFYGEDNIPETYEEDYPYLVRDRHRLPYGYISTGKETYFRIDISWLDNNGNPYYSSLQEGGEHHHHFVPANIFAEEEQDDDWTYDWNGDFFEVVRTGAIAPDPDPIWSDSSYWYQELDYEEDERTKELIPVLKEPYRWALGSPNDGNSGIDSTYHPEATHCVVVRCKRTLEPNHYKQKWEKWEHGRTGSFNRLRNFIGFGEGEHSWWHDKVIEWGKISKFCNPLINKMIRFNKDLLWRPHAQTGQMDDIDFTNLPSHNCGVTVTENYDDRIQVIVQPKNIVTFNIQDWANQNGITINEISGSEAYYITSDERYDYGSTYHLLMSCHYAKTILDSSALTAYSPKFGIPITNGSQTGMRDNPLDDNDMGFKYVGEESLITDGLKVYYTRYKNNNSSIYVDEIPADQYTIGNIFTFPYNENLYQRAINHNIEPGNQHDMPRRYEDIDNLDVSSGYYYIPIEINDGSSIINMIEAEKDLIYTGTQQKMVMIFDKYGVRARYEIPINYIKPGTEIRYLRIQYYVDDSAHPGTVAFIEETGPGSYNEILSSVWNHMFYMSESDGPANPRNYPEPLSFQIQQQDWNYLDGYRKRTEGVYYWDDEDRMIYPYQNKINLPNFIEVTKTVSNSQTVYTLPIGYYSSTINQRTTEISEGQRIGIYIFHEKYGDERKYLVGAVDFHWNQCMEQSEFLAKYTDFNTLGQYYYMPLVGKLP